MRHHFSLLPSLHCFGPRSARLLCAHGAGAGTAAARRRPPGAAGSPQDKPEDTEVWEPVPEGRHARRHRQRRAFGRDRALRRQEPRSMGEREGQVPRRLDGRERHPDRQQTGRQHRDEAQLQELPAAHRMADPGKRDRREPGARQQRRLPRRRPAPATEGTRCRSWTRSRTRPT